MVYHRSMNTKRTCEYCKEAVDKSDTETCPHCGALLPADFFSLEHKGYSYYKGVIVWVFHNAQYDVYEIQFWRGDTLLERFEFSKETIDEWSGGGIYDPMERVYDLFRLAQGEETCLRYAEGDPPKRWFTITVETVEPERGQAG